MAMACTGRREVASFNGHADGMPLARPHAAIANSPPGPRSAPLPASLQHLHKSHLSHRPLPNRRAQTGPSAQTSAHRASYASTTSPTAQSHLRLLRLYSSPDPTLPPCLEFPRKDAQPPRPSVDTIPAGAERILQETMAIKSAKRISGVTVSLPSSVLLSDPYRAGVRLIMDQAMSNDARNFNIAIVSIADFRYNSPVQQASDLPVGKSSSPFSSQKALVYRVAGKQYAVRFHDVSSRALSLSEDGRVCWSNSRRPPESYADAAILIYDVENPNTLTPVPKILDILRQGSIRAALVPSACLQPASPSAQGTDVVEQQARLLCNGITVFHVSEDQSDIQKSCISVLLSQHTQIQRASFYEPIPNTQESRSSVLFAAQSNNEAVSATGFTTRRQSHQQLDLHMTLTTLQEPGNRLSDSSFDQDDRFRSAEEAENENETDPSSVTSSPIFYPGSTLNDLVARLLKPPTKENDASFIYVFLTVYRMFAAPSELLQAIIAHFQRMTGRPDILARNFYIVNQWFHSYPGDFGHPRTHTLLRMFLEAAAAHGVSNGSIDASVAVNVDLDTEWACSDSKLEAKLNDQPHDPIPINTKHTTDTRRPQYSPNPIHSFTKTQWRLFMSHDDIDIARELTRISHALFLSLQPRDLLRQSTSPSTARPYSSTSALANLTAHFNHIAHWTANIILLRDKPKHRALALSKLMRVARKVRQQNDYNTLGALLAGIQGTSIYRLRATWDLITPDQRKDFQRLEVLMASSKGCASYRLAWENTNTSKGRIPFLAVHQRDLVVAVAGCRTFIETNEPDGDNKQAEAGAQETTVNTSFSSSLSSSSASASFQLNPPATKPQLPPTTSSSPPHRRLINWRKFDIIGTTLLSLRAAQSSVYPASSSHYPLYQQQQLHEELRSLFLDTAVQADEEELYRLSCKVEPMAGGSAVEGVGFRGWMERRGWGGDR